jgi:enoyl-CoA hydratase
VTGYRYLDLRREGHTLVCTINNPPKNFLNAAIVRELTTLADDVAADEEVRALVLTGATEGIFVTHYDVSELAGLSEAMRSGRATGGGNTLHPMHQLLLKLQGLRVPVIAAINGTAMGGGCELALACDFRLMARGGRIGLPEVRVGILPGAGGTQRMARLLGTAKALELTLLGNTVDADEAEQIGLVHRAVDADRLMVEALVLANELASRPPLSIELIKRCVLQGSEMGLEEGLHMEQDALWQVMRSEDAGRLMRAYMGSDRPLDEQ